MIYPSSKNIKINKRLLFILPFFLKTNANQMGIHMQATTPHHPLHISTQGVKSKKKVNIVKIVGITVQEIEGYKSFSIKQLNFHHDKFFMLPFTWKINFFYWNISILQHKAGYPVFSWTYNIYRVIDLVLLTNVL